MSRLRRPILILSSVLSLAIVAVLGASMTPAGSRLMKPVESGVLTALKGARPVVDANAQGCLSSGGQCLSPTITISPTETLSNRIAVTGSFTVTCGPFAFQDGRNGFFEVDQAAGHEVAHAFAGFTPNCNGQPQHFTLTAIAQNVPFHFGSAVTSVSINACGDDSNFNFVCESGSATQTVTLTR